LAVSVHTASTWDLVPGLLLVGAGVGIVLGQLIQFILAAVRMNEVGSASGVMEASQQLSASLGVAVLGAIFFAMFKHHPATDALRITSWVCLVPLAAAFIFVFMLPKQAREEEALRRSRSAPAAPSPPLAPSAVCPRTSGPEA